MVARRERNSNERSRHPDPEYTKGLDLERLQLHYHEILPLRILRVRMKGYDNKEHLMFSMTVEVTVPKDHKDYPKATGAYVNVWINSPFKQDAIREAVELIEEEEGYCIHSIDAIEETELEEWNESESFQYAQEAMSHGASYVFHKFAEETQQ